MDRNLGDGRAPDAAASSSLGLPDRSLGMASQLCWWGSRTGERETWISRRAQHPQGWSSQALRGQAMAVEYVTYQGIKFPPAYNSERSLHFAHKEFQVQDDDVFNVTYPKSGTVWMTEILSLIRSGGDPAWNRTILNSTRVPWFTTRLGLESALSYPRPRLLTCHLPILLFPTSFFGSRAKVIYTLRNPKDVLVSYFYFSKMCSSYEDPESFEQFLGDFLSGDVPHGSWFDHVRGWMEMKGKENFFFITYEELQQDLRGSVQRLCQFLEQELDDGAINSVVENASFRAMKENKMCNSTLLPRDIMDQDKGTFLRKGICGDWKNHFTVAQSEAFDRIYQDRMGGLLEAFPWDAR
ncbi:sulfotransferase 2A1 isoform X1 [Mauremys reevesii]|uniref:sulfotransferase 2A1 isoform X1 n=2 Tax=Mauremys reevesii TaxID=260615 RepID=UPI00193FFD25|nr:sulfotransferase 2A1 isoform X1 [Mauremys reevesii]